MSFKFVKTNIEGLMIIKPHIHEDVRGIYRKSYEQNVYLKNGITCEFTECSDVHSVRGALRGLGYQKIESQAKLIRVVSGVLFDVALDLRKDLRMAHYL